MKYELLYSEFTNLFPDDKQNLEQLTERASVDSSDGMHIIFGMVVIPFLMELVRKDEKEKLNRAFEFFEKMANSENSLISEVLEFTILEDIVSGGKDILNICKGYMGPKTLECCDGIEKYMM